MHSSRPSRVKNKAYLTMCFWISLAASKTLRGNCFALMCKLGNHKGCPVYYSVGASLVVVLIACNHRVM